MPLAAPSHSESPFFECPFSEFIGQNNENDGLKVILHATLGRQVPASAFPESAQLSSALAMSVTLPERMEARDISPLPKSGQHAL